MCTMKKDVDFSVRWFSSKCRTTRPTRFASFWHYVWSTHEHKSSTHVRNNSTSEKFNNTFHLALRKISHRGSAQWKKCSSTTMFTASAVELIISRNVLFLFTRPCFKWQQRWCQLMKTNFLYWLELLCLYNLPNVSHQLFIFI